MGHQTGETRDFSSSHPSPAGIFFQGTVGKYLPPFSDLVTFYFFIYYFLNQTIWQAARTLSLTLSDNCLARV